MARELVEHVLLDPQDGDGEGGRVLPADDGDGAEGVAVARRDDEARELGVKGRDLVVELAGELVGRVDVVPEAASPVRHRVGLPEVGAQVQPVAHLVGVARARLHGIQGPDAGEHARDADKGHALEDRLAHAGAELDLAGAVDIVELLDGPPDGLHAPAKVEGRVGGREDDGPGGLPVSPQHRDGRGNGLFRLCRRLVPLEAVGQQGLPGHGGL